MLTAITLFLLSASNEVVGVTVLQKGCMDRFQNALNASDPSVSTKHLNLGKGLDPQSNAVPDFPYVCLTQVHYF